MTKELLLELIEEFDNDTEIRVQDVQNINKYIELKGIEVHRNGKGKPFVVLIGTKILKHEFNG